MTTRRQVGFLFLCLLSLSAILAPIIAPLQSDISPVRLDLQAINLSPFTSNHILGTDYLGCDIFAQAVWGARTALIVGVLAAACAVTFGSLWGAVSALCGGIIDTMMMRIVDGLLSIPNILLLLTLSSLVFAPHATERLPGWLLAALKVNSYSLGLLPLALVALVVAATTWLEAARIARQQVVAIKHDEYVMAAQALGGSFFHIMLRHLLPNAGFVLFVEAALLVSDAILLESGLSFLGLGLGPATPSWGGMLNQAQHSLIEGNWWAVVVPGILISLTVAAVNLIGEGWLKERRQKANI